MPATTLKILELSHQNQAVLPTNDGRYAHRLDPADFQYESFVGAIDERVQRKREIFDLYKQELGSVSGLTLMPEAPNLTGNRWLTAMLVDPEKFGASNVDMVSALASENIESRHVWRPMHLQKAFAGYRVAGGKVAEDINNKGICLPSGTSLSDEDVLRVCSIIKRLRKTKLRGPSSSRFKSTDSRSTPSES